MMKRNNIIKLHILLAIAVMAVFNSRAQVVPPPATPSPVVDYAGVFRTGNERDSLMKLALIDTLKTISRTTGAQLVVVTVSSLDGRDVADYAQELFETWGIGDAKTNSGVLILVKPKTPTSSGKVRIHTGYGTEAILPDAYCLDLINEVMIPKFKQNDYAGAILSASSSIIKVLNGEFDAASYIKEKQKKAALNDWLYGSICCLWPFFLFVWFMWFHRMENGLSLWNDDSYGGSSTLGGSSRRSSRSSGSYSSSSGGGYSYGGGHSGGGGASGSW